jgi:L-threonylcarbamoyladenylate synthase
LTYLLKIDSDVSLRKGLNEAVTTIARGGIVAFPAESFYGLGVDATNPDAVRRLYTIKRRDPHLPVLILISSLNELPQYATSVTTEAKSMAREFWPGGLTMVFYSSPLLPLVLTAGTGKVGIRVSGHPVANALSKALNVPITGTSANVSGRAPCVTADQVVGSLGDQLDLILDGGMTEGRHPSTVLDVTSDPPVMIREGIIRAEQIIKSGIYREIRHPLQQM